jgi:protein-tyrosine phosphatase
LIRGVFSNLLFVGNAIDARDLRLLYDNGIRAVVDLAINEKPAQLGREMIYCRFPINDGDGNSNAIIALVIRTVEALVRDDTRTLVACSAGMSRSPAIAAITLAVLSGREPDECLRQVIDRAPNDISPILWTHIKGVYNEMGRSGRSE